MKVSRERILAEAKATGFRPEVLEKVIQLVGLLEAIRAHPFLKDRLALKGGTALNLFVFDLPRLSVDIDLNYVASAERDVMLAERPKVEQALQAVFGRGGFTVSRQPDDHAGGKWRLRYQSSVTEGGNLEVDLNFMLRVPLWPVTRQDSRPVGSYRAKDIPVLDVHELAAGKLAALLSRHASRDLFDAHQLLTKQTLDPAKLRLAFVLYGAMNRKDWRTVSVDDVGFEERELRDQLTPVLSDEVLRAIGPEEKWAGRLIGECKDALGVVLPFTKEEREFLDLVLDQGEVRPELLTTDLAMADRVKTHPQIQWKAVNVRKHKGEG
jgi:predicted nucleotidyltransferase component of viral defense system